MAERQKLGAVSPCFIVSDASRAVNFYTAKLGFELRFSEPADQPFFAIVGRDLAQIFLKAISAEVTAQPNPTRHEWAPWDAFVYVDDPDSLAAEFASRGVTFHAEIVNRKDGVRGFEVVDNDGYVLFFGAPIEEIAR
ncbi:MAG TPA: VOC family protein [Candidatus Dormibacteraeota bacterium]|nr:VOC family protein [Candidatus Dormibacteraeota bacterium]